jgi:hypothetical protein
MTSRRRTKMHLKSRFRILRPSSAKSPRPPGPPPPSCRPLSRSRPPLPLGGRRYRRRRALAPPRRQ